MRKDLRSSYASSLWTTVIDPRVTLSFFDDEGDALLIHYSDQYTTSASYDAITVTTRRDLYGLAGAGHTPEAIHELNAFNGEWLLRLNTDDYKSRKARLGVIAAYKLLWKVLPQDGSTVWVPLSMEEWVRVAGNIGLPKKAIDFSRPEGGGVLGDDVLFAGFGPRGVELIAVEVKTVQASPDFAKARAQASNLLSHMLELLNKSGLAGRVLRSLFVRQILLTCEKYNLFNIFPEKYFESVVANSEGWLAGEFDVVRSQSFPSRVVIAHVESVLGIDLVSNGGVLGIVVPGGQFNHLVETPLRDLRPEEYGLSREEVIRCWQLSGADADLDDEGVGGGVDEGEDDSSGTEAEDTSNQGAEESLVAGEASGSGMRLEVEADTERPPTGVAVGRPGESRPSAINEVSTIWSSVAEPSAVSGDKASGSNASAAVMSVRFGFDLHSGRPVDWFPTDTNRVFNANAGIIGTMGTGKTEFTKSLVTQLGRDGSSNVDGYPVDVLILDYKGDYIKREFVEATNAKVYDLYRLPLNPLALYGAMQMLPMHTASGFRTTLSKAFKLGVKQQTRIKNLVLECYQHAGIDSGDRSSWARPAPTIADVWSRFLASDSRAEDSLYSALDGLNSFEIFEPDSLKTKSLLEFVSGVTVVNLSGADTKIQNLVVAVILDLLYLQMHQRGPSMLDGHYRQLRNVVLVDEADNFMSQGFESLRKILKEGREFGVATILSTQELTHFRGSDDDYAQYILTWIVHRVGSIQPSDVRGIFGVEAKGEVEGVVRSIRELGKHQSLYRDADKKTRVIRDLAFWQLMQVPGAVDGAVS
jgi:DNA phosphorothioation-dependent restriction protein DptH